MIPFNFLLKMHNTRKHKQAYYSLFWKHQLGPYFPHPPHSSVLQPVLHVCYRNEVRTDGGQGHHVGTDKEVHVSARHHAPQPGLHDRTEVRNRNETQTGV